MKFPGQLLSFRWFRIVVNRFEAPQRAAHLKHRSLLGMCSLETLDLAVCRTHGMAQLIICNGLCQGNGSNCVWS
jgi:hypothetical protein